MRGCVLHIGWSWSLPRGVGSSAFSHTVSLSVLCVPLYVLSLEHVSSTSILTGIKRECVSQLMCTLNTVSS